LTKPYTASEREEIEKDAQSIAQVLLIFFVFTLTAYVVLRIFSLKSTSE